MSLVGTLAKVAIGVAIAKGVSTLAKGAKASSGNASQANSQGGLGDLLGGMLGGGAQSGQQPGGPSGQQAGGLGDLLGSLMGGGQTAQSGQSGDLGDLLGGLTGPKGAGQNGMGRSAIPTGQGGLGDLLGSLMGGAQGGTQQAGGLGNLLGGLLGGGAAGGLGGLMGALTGGAQGGAQGNDQNLGQVLNSSFTNEGEPDVEPTPQQNAAAAILLAAMIQAAKSDGKIQQAEKDKLLSTLKNASPEEMAFVQSQLGAPVSIPTLVRHVPDGLQSKVYTMSLMAIDLDAQAEAQYLNDLAKALGLAPRDVNQIHAQLGVPALYA